MTSSLLAVDVERGNILDNVAELSKRVRRLEENGGGVTSSVSGGGGTGVSDTVSVSANDALAGYLDTKLVASSPVTLTQQNDGANESLLVAITPHLVADAHHNWPLTEPDIPSGIVRDTRLITAGSGLTGGGDLSTDLTINVGAGDGISVAVDSVAVDSTVVRTTRSIAAGSGLTGGGALSANLTVNVGAGAGITVNADDVALTTPGSLSATSTNSPTGGHTHAIDSSIARSAVTITAGSGLTGGGDLSANRTINVGAGDGVSVAADSVAVDSTVVRTTRTITAGSGLTGGGALSADLTINVGAGDGISVAADSVAVDSTVVRTTRTLTAGAGLTGGGTLAADRTFAVGAGAGITVNADDVALTTPGSLSVSTANVSTGSHTHAITASSAPGAAAALLKTSASGQLIIADMEAVTLTVTAAVDSSLIPTLTDTYDLGSATKLWRKGWLSELESILFVENSVQVTGGWWLIPHASGVLPGDVASAATQVNFGTAMTPNDFVLLRGNLQVEYMQVGTLVSGTTYNVTRNLDGTGANDWPGGQVFVVLGITGDGRIELDAQTAGPRISVIEQGAAYNAQTERVRIGDLAGWGSLTGYGIAIGTAAGNRLTYDPTNGLIVAGEGSGVTNINGGNIQTNTITATQIAANTITAAEILAGTITATQIAADTITAGQIAAGTITATEIAAGTITATQIAADTITAGQIAANTITSAEILAGTITAAQIAAGTITATEIAAGTITATQIAADTITAAQIAAGTITATELNVTTLSAITADMGTLTAGTVTGATIRTAASGARIEMNGSRIFGTNGTTTQWEALGSDGKLTAGGGDVILDSDGITLIAGAFLSTQNTLKWETSGGVEQMMIGSDSSGNAQVKGTGGTLSLGVGVVGQQVQITSSIFASSLDLRLDSAGAQIGTGAVVGRSDITPTANEIRVYSAAGVLTGKISTDTTYLRINDGVAKTIYMAQNVLASAGVTVGTGLVVGYTGVTATSEQIRLYNGTTLMGQLSTADTTWLRINQDVAKNIYTPQSIAAGGHLAIGHTLIGSAGYISYTGDLQSRKGGTNFTGKIVVPLTAALTSTSWDGDAKTSGSSGTIDLSTVFGVSAYVKGVLVRIAMRSSVADVVMAVGPSAGNYAVICRNNVTNKYWEGYGLCPTNGTGDIYVYCSGNIDNAIIEIWGYLI